MNATQLNGGTVKIADSSVFSASATIAVAEVSYSESHIEKSKKLTII
jgi:hypothetical protein